MTSTNTVQTLWTGFSDTSSPVLCSFWEDLY